MVQSCIRAFALVSIGALATPLTADFQNFGAASNGHTISGRVVDRHHLRPEDLTLMVGRRDRDQNSFGRSPVAFKADGSFITQRLDPETYVLELVRTPHSATKPEASVGLTLV